MSADESKTIVGPLYSSARIDVLAGITVELDRELIEQRDALVAEAEAIDVVDEDSFETADDLVARVAGLCKALEANRKALKRPVLDLGKRIDEACDTVATVLLALKGRLADAIADHLERLQAERASAEARAAAVLTGPDDDTVPGVRLDAGAVGELAAARQVATVELDVPTDPVPCSAVSVRIVKSVEVFDYAAIPHTVNGLAMLKPDLATIRRMLVAGVDVPGCRIVERRSTATRGRW